MKVESKSETSFVEPILCIVRHCWSSSCETKEVAYIVDERENQRVKHFILAALFYGDTSFLLFVCIAYWSFYVRT